MLKEERVLFPLCRQLDTSETRPAAPGGTIGNPIQRMIEEHDDAGNALARFRELTNGYVPPADACNTYRALFQALAELEQDMHQHVHKENNILFPKALRAERLLAH
jgi:regulator of cell morphogenesis and NO signaling